MTGVTLAGVYPPGMKLIATWCKKDRGFGIGLLVGALTLGSALPHLINGLSILGNAGMPPWRSVIFISSAGAVVAFIISGLFIKPGPFLSQKFLFNWRYIGQAFKQPAARYANFGYFGHMWELYAMWTWVPLFLIISFETAGLNPQTGRIWGFTVIAAGAVGSVCAGVIADRIGRTNVTIWSLIISGFCAIIVGFFFSHPVILTLICII